MDNFVSGQFPDFPKLNKCDVCGKDALTNLCMECLGAGMIWAAKMAHEAKAVKRDIQFDEALEL